LRPRICEQPEQAHRSSRKSTAPGMIQGPGNRVSRGSTGGNATPLTQRGAMCGRPPPGHGTDGAAPGCGCCNCGLKPRRSSRAQSARGEGHVDRVVAWAGRPGAPRSGDVRGRVRPVTRPVGYGTGPRRTRPEIGPAPSSHNCALSLRQRRTTWAAG
jgi:hypothetical protein